jgi:hypothetical protein
MIAAAEYIYEGIDESVVACTQPSALPLAQWRRANGAVLQATCSLQQTKESERPEFGREEPKTDCLEMPSNYRYGLNGCASHPSTCG